MVVSWKMETENATAECNNIYKDQRQRAKQALSAQTLCSANITAQHITAHDMGQWQFVGVFLELCN